MLDKLNKYIKEFSFVIRKNRDMIMMTGLWWLIIFHSVYINWLHFGMLNLKTHVIGKPVYQTQEQLLHLFLTNVFAVLVLGTIMTCIIVFLYKKN